MHPNQSETVLGEVTGRKNGNTFRFTHTEWADRHCLEIRLMHGDRPDRWLAIPKWVLPALREALDKFANRVPDEP